MDNVNNRGIGALVRHPYADKTGAVVSVTDEENPVARVEFRHDSGVVTHGDFPLPLIATVEPQDAPEDAPANE